jgi:nucleoid-associated protein YgaU
VTFTPTWVPNGPNPVVIAGGGQTVEAWLIGNPAYGRASGSSASASAGTGGWQVVDRTRQKAATEWLDTYPFAMTMKLRLDGDASNSSAAGSVEGAIAALESFELPTVGSYPPLPPILTIWGPIPHTELFWVCSRLDVLGDEDDVIRDSTGNRTMQNLSIELTEYSPSSIVQSALTPAQLAVQIGTGTLAGSNAPLGSGSTTLVASGKTYTVKAGDTFQSIAATQLGNVADWVNIALLNGLSYSSPLRPDQVLQLPAP